MTTVHVISACTIPPPRSCFYVVLIKFAISICMINFPRTEIDKAILSFVDIVVIFRLLLVHIFSSDDGDNMC